MADQQILDRLANIRMLSLDTDGVLTDGGLYYTETGDTMRKFNVKDGLGMKLAQGAGVVVIIITASATPAIEQRGKVLGVDHVFLKTEDKVGKLTELCRELGIGMDQVAHVGDDTNDLPVLRAVGCPITVADGIDDAKEVAVYITDKKGGDGAVREICDLIVKAKSEAS